MWSITMAGTGTTIRGSGADAVLRRRGLTGIRVPVIIIRIIRDIVRDIVRRRHRRVTADTAEHLLKAVSTCSKLVFFPFGAGFLVCCTKKNA